MIKRCGLLTKREGMSFEDFRDHWVGHHAALVARTPGLKRYTVNVIDRREHPNSPIDGFSELWFEDRESMDAAFRPEGGIKGDEPTFVGGLAVVLVDEHEIVP